MTLEEKGVTIRKSKILAWYMANIDSANFCGFGTFVLAILPIISYIIFVQISGAIVFFSIKIFYF